MITKEFKIVQQGDILDISDGYHTFKELYDYKILYLCTL
jgi:hypothetical protein